MQPPGIPSDTWNTIFHGALNEVSSTWGDYVTTFDSDALLTCSIRAERAGHYEARPFQISYGADGLCRYLNARIVCGQQIRQRRVCP